MGRLAPDVEQAEQGITNRAPQYQDVSEDLPQDSDHELEDDVMQEPEPPGIEDQEEEDEGGPRKVRRRFYRSPEYWKRRSEGAPPLGTMHEGSMPVRIGPGAQSSMTHEGEPPSKRRIVLDQIPEESEPEQVIDQEMSPPAVDMEEYSPSQAPEALPPEPEVPELSLPEALNEPHAPDSQSMQAEPATDLAPSEAEDRLNQAADVPIPVASDDELLVDIGEQKCKLSESP